MLCHIAPCAPADQATDQKVGQFIGKFGDILGLQTANDEATSKVFHSILSKQLGDLEKRGVSVEFSEGSNPFKAITASRPIGGTNGVMVALDRHQILSLYTDPVQRREMVWFALLHELQNAARASTFRRLHRKGEAGQMSESDWVRAEISTEVNAIQDAYAVYVSEVYPKLHLLSGESRGTIQAGYGEWLKQGKDKMVDHHIRSELGEYYRQTYRALRKQPAADKTLVNEPAGS